MTGLVAPPYDRIAELPFDMQMIYHSLVMEQLSPIKIVLGYHGYKSEFTLRKALIKFIGKNIQTKGFGVVSFPHLIISGEYSLIKLNGQPYCPKLREDHCWDFYASSNVNPLLLLLELIWTKLAREYDVGGFWGEDLQIEVFSPLLSAKAATFDGKSGWIYGITEFTDKQLKMKRSTVQWQPVYLNIYQFSVIQNLCSGKRIIITDSDFLNWLQSEGVIPEQLIVSLIQTGLVALGGDELRLITEACVCAVLQNGQFVAAENNAGRFTRWLAKQMPSNNV